MPDFARMLDELQYNIIVMLGLPLVAIALSAAYMFGVKWRQGPGSLIIDGVVLRWRPAQLAAAGSFCRKRE